jgi:hypothetical protein
MKISEIALIDTRTGTPGESLGTLLSVHNTMSDAFAANEHFQKRCRGRHVVVRIVTLQQTVMVGELVKPCHLAREGSK